MKGRYKSTDEPIIMSETPFGSDSPDASISVRTLSAVSLNAIAGGAIKCLTSGFWMLLKKATSEAMTLETEPNPKSKHAQTNVMTIPPIERMWMIRLISLSNVRGMARRGEA